MTETTPRRPSPKALPLCDHCQREELLCVCGMLQPARCKHRVVMLQHPQEQDRTLGSAPLVTRGIKGAEVVVGLSWRNLAAAIGEAESPLRPWAVLYPASLPKAGRDVRPRDNGRSYGAFLMNARGRVLPAWPALGGIILLDGTWSQAKALWWRNPWLLKLPRLGFTAPPQSIYGRVRKEPKPGYMSTLEATAAALDSLDEDPAVGQELRRAFRTLVQRLRDVHAATTPARASRGHRRAQRALASSSGEIAASIKVETQPL